MLTCWEAVDHEDQAVAEQLRKVDLHCGLEGAGFVDIQVRERPEWRVAERAMWAEAAVLDPGDDPALRPSTTRASACYQHSTAPAG